MVLNRNNRKEIAAIDDLIQAKVYVCPARFEELQRLKQSLWNPDAQLPTEPCTLLCFNVSPMVEYALRSLPQYNLQLEQISEDKIDPSHKEDRKRFLKVFGGKKLEEAQVGAIIHEVQTQGEELSLLDRRVIALSLMNKLPVLVVSTTSTDPLPAAAAVSGGTWPVFYVPGLEDMRPVCQWLVDELPRVRALSAAVEAELQARVAHLAKVNVPWHFMSRASVALVPFGVMAVNFLGILRLMASMLTCVGMRGDTSANRALGLLGAKNAALVTAIDSLGDVYSFAVFSTVLADLQMLSLVEAAEALTVLDGLMLGSVSVVTGTVSALGAYLSRPVMVRAAAEFLASLQIIHVLNPAMRRVKEKRSKPRKGGKGSLDGKTMKETGARRRRGASSKGAVVAETEERQGLLALQRSGPHLDALSGKAAKKRAKAAKKAVAASKKVREEDLEPLPSSSAGGQTILEEGEAAGPEGSAVVAQLESAEAAREGGEGKTAEEAELSDDDDGAESPSLSSEIEEEEDNDEVGAGADGEEPDLDDADKDRSRQEGSGASTAGRANTDETSFTRTASAGDQGDGDPVPVPPDDVAAMMREEKRAQSVARKKAAAEAKAAAAAARATEKAERKAAKLAARQQAREAKELLREQQAAEKAEAKAATAAEKAEVKATKEAEKAEARGAKAAEKAAARQAKQEAAEARAAAKAAAKAEKQASRKASKTSAMASSEPSEAQLVLSSEVAAVEEERIAASICAVMPGTSAPPAQGSGPRRSHRSGAGGDAEANGDVGTSVIGNGSMGEGCGSSMHNSSSGRLTERSQEELEEDGEGGKEEEEEEERAAREVQMGLDEETCLGLMRFLCLTDEEVYENVAGAEGRDGNAASQGSTQMPS